MDIGRLEASLASEPCPAVAAFAARCAQRVFSLTHPLTERERLSVQTAIDGATARAAGRSVHDLASLALAAGELKTDHVEDQPLRHAVGAATAAAAACAWAAAADDPELAHREAAAAWQSARDSYACGSEHIARRLTSLSVESVVLCATEAAWTHIWSLANLFDLPYFLIVFESPLPPHSVTARNAGLAILALLPLAASLFNLRRTAAALSAIATARRQRADTDRETAETEAAALLPSWQPAISQRSKTLAIGPACAAALCNRQETGAYTLAGAALLLVLVVQLKTDGLPRSALTAAGLAFQLSQLRLTRRTVRRGEQAAAEVIGPDPGDRREIRRLLARVEGATRYFAAMLRGFVRHHYRHRLPYYLGHAVLCGIAGITLPGVQALIAAGLSALLISVAIKRFAPDLLLAPAYYWLGEQTTDIKLTAKQLYFTILDGCAAILRDKAMPTFEEMDPERAARFARAMARKHFDGACAHDLRSMRQWSTFADLHAGEPFDPDEGGPMGPLWPMGAGGGYLP